MQLRKSKVSMAVAATLGLACVVPSASFGVTKYSVNTNTQAGTLNTSSGGDTLLFPFYTVANGSVTSFSVTNSSSDQVIAAKIRFREQRYSVDVFDMYVFLSPNDKFDFFVKEDPETGTPMISWDDNSCVVGPPNGARSVPFNPPWQGFAQTEAQMRLGHVEVLGVVDLSGTWLADYAKHKSDGVPGGCSVLNSVFKSAAKVAKLNLDEAKVNGGWVNDHLEVGGYGTLKDVGNVLMGRYIINTPEMGMGMEAGGDAIAIRDTDLATPYPKAAPFVTPGGSPAGWHVVAHSGGLCTPNCRTQNQYAWDQIEDSHPHLGEMWNLAGFQLALGAKSVAGDWSNNTANRVNVDWVLSFPSKYAYMDYIDGKWQLLEHPKAQEWLPAIERYNSDRVWTGDIDVSTIETRLESVFTVYDTEEKGETGVSPSDPRRPIPNEMNVLTLVNTKVYTDGPFQSIIQMNGGG